MAKPKVIISAVFELPIDASYADPERAKQYLEQLHGEPDLEDAPNTSGDNIP